MEHDYNMYQMVGGVIVFPDYVFTDTPKQPADIKEAVYIIGTPVAGISIQGSVDNP